MPLREPETGRFLGSDVGMPQCKNCSDLGQGTPCLCCGYRPKHEGFFGLTGCRSYYTLYGARMAMSTAGYSKSQVKASTRGVMRLLEKLTAST